jgi:hypothetical protein
VGLRDYDMGSVLPLHPIYTRRLEWSVLMRRAFGVDVLRCPNCDARMKIIAIIDDERVAVKILAHLGLQTRAPPRAPPWRPRPKHSSGHAEAQAPLLD